MRKIIILIFILALLLPITVNAENNYLYDVLKNEAESNGLAREYTGEHHDSFTKEPSHKIYHWYGSNSENANSILDKWNVIFGGFCWQMIRTTDTGGVKIIYNGIPDDGKCNNTGDNQQIGTSRFNNSDSVPAYVGYMYNTLSSRNVIGSSSESLFDSSEYISTSVWYADSVNWNSSTSKWELINPYRISGTSDYPNLVGKYTFHHPTEGYKNSEVRYIAAVNNNNYYYINMTNGNDISYYNDTYTYGDSYINNGNNTYTINNPTTISKTDYYSNYNKMRNKYICKNAINNTCSELWLNTSSINTYSINYIKSTDLYKYAEGFTYNNGTYTLTGDSVTNWDRSESSYKRSLNSHHYTCWNANGECTTISYVYHAEGITPYYVNITDGNNIQDFLNKMLNDDNVNSKNSAIKTYVDNWYQNNMTNYTSNLEDTIFCNNRSIEELGGFNPNGGNLDYNLRFKESNERVNDLSCTNITDKFCMSNTKAQLTYPVGLMTRSEMSLLGNNNLVKTGSYYWLASPKSCYNSSYYNAYNYYSNMQGVFSIERTVENNYGVRPAISLKPKTRYLSGTGTKNDPYIVDLNNYYSIDVEINNETEDLTIEIDDLTKVEEGETVNFNVTPIKGHKVTSIRIIDENNEEVEYNTTDNKNFVFTMPATNVTIIPSFERVKNAVNVEDNKNTKEFVIEVNDSQAVVYEDTVRFRVDPEEGYEVEKIEITDEEQNNINYRKTNNKNEYEFTMPDTNVLIKPFYRLIPTNGNLSNPNTKRQILLIIISVIILSIMTFIYIKKKKHKN